MRISPIPFGVCFLLVSIAGVSAHGEDWPTYLHDNARSGVTNETLKLPLWPAWEHQPRLAPKPAWPAPAKQDFWHEIRELKPVVTYDRCFHTVIAGGLAYFGSSADDKVHCLDTATGQEIWSFFTGGPVRLAPSLANGKVYFGSDDGWMYCLSAADGKLLWKHRPAEQDRLIPGNGRVMSSSPCRTGVLVDNGVAYYGAGLFPPVGVYLCALDAEKGKVIWQRESERLSPQGYILSSASRLFFPTGRTNPALIDRATGDETGVFGGGGGAYAIVVDDAVVSGPGRRSGEELTYSEAATREAVATFPGIRMVVVGNMSYLESKDKLSAIDRGKYVAISRERNTVLAELKKQDDLLKKAKNDNNADEVTRLTAETGALQTKAEEMAKQMSACTIWETRIEDPYSLIFAGDTLFAGGEGVVVGIRASDGAEVWRDTVNGRAYGLSVADGRLYVSTDIGSIYCFTSNRTDRAHVVRVAETPGSYPEDDSTAAYAESANRILSLTGINKGYCLVLDCGEGQLIYELAKRSDLRLVGIDKNKRNIEAARLALERAGLYGSRAAVLQWDKDTLPFTTYMFNLIVSDGAIARSRLPDPSPEVLRVLRPYGGCVCVGRPAATKGVRGKLDRAEVAQWFQQSGMTEATWTNDGGAWAVVRRGAVPGAGEWTQLYADSGHTACSRDELRGPMVIQWFGEPGPREIIDRHHRPMASLVRDGRVFVPANDRVFAIDAYNGTPLWDLEAPNSRRIGAMKNCGQMLLADDTLYLAVEGKCWVIEAPTGKQTGAFDLPRVDDAPHDWGYLDRSNNTLVGTGQKPGASFSQLTWDTCDLLEGDHRPVIISQFLFALDRDTGKKQWVHHKGAILNAGIAIEDGKIFFIESRKKEIVNDEDGRVRLRDFLASDAYLVALELENGKKAWEQEVSLPFQHILYVNAANGVVLVSGTYNENGQVFYGLRAHDTASGQTLWNTAYRALDVRGNDFAEPEGSHGEQWQHPVIIGSAIYSRPYAFDLHSGAKLDYIAKRGGHGCGGLTGSAYYLYGRGDNPRMYPTETKETSGIPLTLVTRPGCWLNIIPAGGLVVIPESSSGCTCAYPLQTSLALVPEALCASSIQ